MAGIGEALSSSRERRGLSIDQVAQDTRISPRFLEALEAEQFQELPAPVYVRGFLRSYATYLGLEAQELLDELPGANGTSHNGANGRNGHSARGRTDPFRRGSVVAATTVAAAPKAPAALEVVSRSGPDDSWAPEPLAPIAPPHEDHGYIPGSDLMESPEFAPEEEVIYAEPEPRFDRRTAGVLAERPPFDKSPGVPRKLALLGAGVIAVLAFLGLAVFMTRDDDGGGGSSAAATGNEPTGLTVGTVVTGDGGTATALATLSPSASPAAGDPAVQAATSPTGTVAPRPTTAGGAAATATATPTAEATPAPTSVPTAAPTAVPTRIPTVVSGPPPHPATYAACNTAKETEKCGSSNVRVICFPPFAETDPTGKNDNYFVDVTGEYPLQPGWRETSVYAPVSIGPVLEAGRDGCV